MKQLQRLYPDPAALPLKGLYLRHNLLQRAAAQSRPFVYSNFIQSMDGRIAILNPENEQRGLPKAIANGRDWRMFQELAAQADAMIVTGSFMEKFAAGFAPDMLMLNNPKYAYLKQYRADNGLAALPDLVVVSRALNFPIAPKLLSGRSIYVMTTDMADPGRIAARQAEGASVHTVGRNAVDGKQMIDLLAAVGHRTIYSAAGPTILHLLAASGVLCRQYLTLAHRLVAGSDFLTITQGDEITPATKLKLFEMYLDEAVFGGAGQLFVSYDVVTNDD